MRVLTVINQKGGVGKTSISVFLAEYFALIRGMRVLLQDIDPQCNLSNHYLPMELGSEGQVNPKPVVPPLHDEYKKEIPEDAIAEGRPSTADIWLSGSLMEYDTAYPNIKIVPGHGHKLKTIENRDDVRDEVIEFFRAFIWSPELSLEKDYDIVVIDTSPELKPVTLSGLRAATDIVIPAIMNELGTEGLSGMLSHYVAENDERQALGRPLVNLAGILPNMFRKQSSMHSTYYHILHENKDVAPYLLNNVVPQSTEYEKALGNRAPSIFSKPNTTAYRALKIVCDEIAERMGI